MDVLFLDRDLGDRLGNALRLIGVEVVLFRERYPGTGRLPDDEWIPDVAAAGMVILTHDDHIRRRRGEWEVFVAARARCFVLATRTPTPFVNLRALMLGWERMEAVISSESPPFMYGMDSRGTLRRYAGPSSP
jgi:hypothetical protein